MDAFAKVSRGKLFSRLFLLGLLGLTCSTPYLFWVLRGLVDAAPTPPPIPLWGLVLLQVGQTGVLLALACLIGVGTAPKIGLGAPVTEALLRKEPLRPLLRALWLRAALWGSGVSLVMLAVTAAFRAQHPGTLPEQPLAPWWLGLFTPFFGGVVEELLTRWGLTSLLAFALLRLRVTRELALWVAVVLAATAFGALHLPLAFTLMGGPTPALIAYVLLGNALGGVVFGGLFVRRGLEAAMIAHGVADIWLHVIFPLVS